MSPNAALVRWCTTCAAEAEFEQPGCVDGHEGDCPEWVCVQCGEAVLVGFTLAEPLRLAVGNVA